MGKGRSIQYEKERKRQTETSFIMDLFGAIWEVFSFGLKLTVGIVIVFASIISLLVGTVSGGGGGHMD